MTFTKQVLLLSTVGLPFDLINCSIAIRRDRQENAPSPIPFLTLLLHGLILLFSPILFEIKLIVRILAVLLAACFHILFLSMIPEWINRLFSKN